MSKPAAQGPHPAPERSSFLLHLALSAIAIAQPFYSVTGKTLNFFVAWRMSGVEYTLCVLFIYLGPPVVTWLLVSLGYRLHRHLGRLLSFLIFWLYISLTGMVATQQFARSLLAPGYEATLGIVVLLLAAAAFLAAALLANLKAQGFVRFFAAVTVVFPALMLLRAYDVGVIEFSKAPRADKITAADRPNVIVIIYDELPITTILDANGLIDSEKFPNFYEFARGATWLPNARSTSGFTETAVPSILAGQARENGVPATYKSYPENIFQQLGPSYNVLDLQFATDLNPARQPGETAGLLNDSERFGRIARDAAIILAHVVAPRQLTSGLPPVNKQHNRFGEDVLQSWQGIRHHEKFVAALSQARQPFLAVYHNIYPHNSWNHYPSGRPYPESRWGDYIALADRTDATLRNDNARIVHDYQAHLLQSMHADKLFGELLTQLKRNGQYEHSIITLVADHGVSLWPGERPREPSEFRLPDLLGIPLILKLPEQSSGGISLDPVHTIDIYPTILDYLGVAAPKRLQGKSFIKSIRDALPPASVKTTPHRDDVTLRRRIEWFGTGTSMADLYGLGKFRSYMGRNVNEFEIAGVPEAVVHLFGTGSSRAGPQLSARIDAQIEGGARDGQPRDILVALGDRICGAAQTTDLEVSGQANSFTLIVAEGCLGLLKQGIRVFVAGSDGRLAEMAVDNGQPETPAATIDQIADGLAGLIGGLRKVADIAQGQVKLQALRERGVAVPSQFVRGQQLASPWGEIALQRDHRRWVIDLFSAPKDVCKAIHLRAGTIPGIARIAATGAARDEASVPVTAEHAELACSNGDSDVIRIIAEDSVAGVARPGGAQVIAKLAEFVGGLRAIPEDGRISLQTLREAGVSVPKMFDHDQQLAWPWGDASLIRDGRRWIFDLYSAPQDVCEAVQLAAAKIPGVTHIATSSRARDEAPVPVTGEHAKATCAKAESGSIRIVFADTPTRTVAPPINQLLAQLAELIDRLDHVSTGVEGQVTLQALRQSGVVVPEIFVGGQQLGWPWGEVTLTRSEREWLLDLHSAPRDICKAIQLGANEIPRISRIATSSLARDEASVPVTAEHADVACSNTNSDVIRIIATDKSTTRLALRKLRAAWRRFGRMFDGN